MTTSVGKIHFDKLREHLAQFNFGRLFIEELGWLRPRNEKPADLNIKNENYSRRQISELGGVVVFEIQAPNGRIPDSKTRAAVHKEISRLHHENLIIFVDAKRTQSLWYWGKREGPKFLPREHIFVKGQPGDLFLSKIGQMVVGISELDEHGNIPVVKVAGRLKNALDVERVTKKFYTEYDGQRLVFLELIEGIPDEHQRRWYASILLNRLMFIYFLQKKGFIDNGDLNYLQHKMDQSKKQGKDRFYGDFLNLLFFEGFAKPEQNRSAKAKKKLGTIKYLNGGLFLPHRIEQDNHEIRIPDKAFENILDLFQRYSWNLNDLPGGDDNEINPDVLGYIFEKYINQKAFGAYYTRPEITEYLCEKTIHNLILDKIKKESLPCHRIHNCVNISDLFMDLDADIGRRLLNEVLPKLSLLDPACGSGAFLVAAMKTLINIYAAVIGKIKFLNDRNLSSWLKKAEQEHKSIHYFIKKRIITDNLYGVDIMEEAAEIAKLRLFLALVASAESADQLEPLPNIDFNILTGNSLMGMMRVADKAFENHQMQGNLFRKSYREILAEKNRLIETYRHNDHLAEQLTSLRDTIQRHRMEDVEVLDELLLAEFNQIGIKYEQATWDSAKNQEGKVKKRSLAMRDIRNLHPFHWGYEFDKILNERGGFDAIITNPPWEIFKPNSKEFFEEFSDLVTKKKMTIKDFETEQTKLLKDFDIRKAWLEYLSGYPHVSAFYRQAPQYRNQISIVDGKKAGTDINLYKLFTEQCFNLLREGGYCGIVIPSGIYTDLGTKQLREMLFTQAKITGLFCFENRKVIFEGVDSRFKFIVLSFEKGGRTGNFPAAFMRHDVAELDRFPQESALNISVDLIRRLSPDSLSVMEFKTPIDVVIAEKMLKWPLLGEEIDGKWNLTLGNEFHMTNDSRLFKTEPRNKRVPLYEGKMVWHFEHRLAQAKYWVEESAGRKVLLGKNTDSGQPMNYQGYRLAHRSIASNTNERTMVATIIPPSTFFGHSLNATVNKIRSDDLLYVLSVMCSFVIDYALRIRVTTNLTMFYIYQIPVPRLTEKDAAFQPIVKRAARLICTTSEFDDLAKEVGLKSHKDGATDPAERAKLRAELDGMIAHLYELTEEEFAYILTTFPLVDQAVRDVALEVFRTQEKQMASKNSIEALIAGGESASLEFKSSARWDIHQNKLNKEMENVIAETVAAFLNSDGGTLLIGVEDNGNIIGLDYDYKTLGKRQNRDGFQNRLISMLLDHYGKDFSQFIGISFGENANKDVCVVTIKQSPKPAYVKSGTEEYLYIRAGNTTRRLTSREAVEYCKNHWGNESASSQTREYFVEKTVKYWKSHGTPYPFLETTGLSREEQCEIYLAAHKRYKPNRVIDIDEAKRKFSV